MYQVFFSLLFGLLCAPAYAGINSDTSPVDGKIDAAYLGDHVHAPADVTQDANNRFVTDAEKALLPTADEKASFPADASALLPLVLTNDPRLEASSTWYGIRTSDPDPLPVSGAWIRDQTNEFAWSKEGVVRVVGLNPSPVVKPTFPGAIGYGTSTTGGHDRSEERRVG